LSDLTTSDVDKMLTLDETLFIEHKSGIGEPASSFKLRQAVASFANTAGGWLLVGVANGRVIADSNSPWVGAGARPLVDLVRDGCAGVLIRCRPSNAKPCTRTPAVRSA
jgi:hypothetical protein